MTCICVQSLVINDLLQINLRGTYNADILSSFHIYIHGKYSHKTPTGLFFVSPMVLCLIGAGKKLAAATFIATLTLM